MGFKELKKAFDVDMLSWRGQDEAGNELDFNINSFRYWQLRLLFEIAGNLDSLVVSNRKAEKHIERMSIAYADLVKIQKDKADKANGA